MNEEKHGEESKIKKKKNFLEMKDSFLFLHLLLRSWTENNRKIARKCINKKIKISKNIE